jgi:hypothetical protein
MKYYNRKDLLEIIDRAEIVLFVARALLIEFQKPKVENWDNVSLDLTNCRSVEEEEVATALSEYASRNSFEIHFPHQGDPDCWLYQGTLHKGPAIRVSVTNHSNNGMGRTSIIHITATLEPR